MAKIGEAHVKIVANLGDPDKRVELRVYEYEVDHWASENEGEYTLGKYRKELAQVIEQTIPEVQVVLTEEVPGATRGDKSTYRFHIYHTAEEFPLADIYNTVYTFLRVKIMQDKVKAAEDEVKMLNEDVTGWQTSLDRLKPTKNA